MSAHEPLLRGRALPDSIPLFPLVGALLLPGGRMPLNIFEPRYIRMIDDALCAARLVGMVQPRNGIESGAPALYDVGCGGRIAAFAETDDGRYLVTLLGRRRFRIVSELAALTPYRQARVDWNAFPADSDADPTTEFIDRERLMRAVRRYLSAEGIKPEWDVVDEAPTEALVVSLAMGCPFAPNEKQALLEAVNARERADCLITLMEIAAGGECGGEPQVQ